VRWFSLTLVVPIGVALYYDEPTLPFIVPLIGGTALGVALERLRGSARSIGLREGFAVVALGWLLVAMIASVPYIVDGGDASRPVDALFEGMSGITATGSSVIADLQGHDQALLFWRSLTQWVGGMGIVVLAIALLPGLGSGGGLAERETSGHDYQKLLPRARDSAARLWFLYVGLSIADSAGTVVQEIALRPESGDADGSGDGPPVLPGQWKGDRLEVKRTTPRGTMTQTFALSDKGQSLVVSTKVEPSGGRPGFENKRVYRRAAAS